MKKSCSIVLILVMLFAVYNAYAESEATSYLDYDEISRKLVSERLPNNYIEIDELGSGHNQLGSNWYVVNESCTIGNAPIAPFTPGGIGIKGEVHIVIADGATLTIIGGFGMDEGQTGGGKLYVHGEEYGNCNLVIEGTPYDKAVVTGGNYAYGQGIELEEFSVYGCNVTITAADGIQGLTPFESSGKEGCAAVKNTRMNIYNSIVKLYGGNGGDSSNKKAFQGRNDGGNGGAAILLSGVDLQGGTLELYGGNGGKHIIGSGRDGEVGRAVYSSSIHVDNGAISDAKTGSTIKLDDISDYQSVIISTQNIRTASVFGSGSLVIVVIGFVIISTIVILILMKKKNAKKE